MWRIVSPADFKKKVEEIISQDYKVAFLGKRFDEIVCLLTVSKADKIYSWIEKVVAKEFQPILVGSDKRYKSWEVSELLTFRYPFRIENNEYRILFVKVKDSIYIEFHLGDHKYYDKVRKDLELKKSCC